MKEVQVVMLDCAVSLCMGAKLGGRLTWRTEPPSTPKSLAVFSSCLNAHQTTPQVEKRGQKLPWGTR